MPTVRKAELSFLYVTRRLVLFYISAKYYLVNLVCDTSSRPDLHFYQVSSKYSKGYSSYRADKKFYADANRIHPKNNVPPLTFGSGGGGT